jgi:hypothetical protein
MLVIHLDSDCSSSTALSALPARGAANRWLRAISTGTACRVSLSHFCSSSGSTGRCAAGVRTGAMVLPDVEALTPASLAAGRTVSTGTTTLRPSRIFLKAGHSASQMDRQSRCRQWRHRRLRSAGPGRAPISPETRARAPLRRMRPYAVRFRRPHAGTP